MWLLYQVDMFSQYLIHQGVRHRAEAVTCHQLLCIAMPRSAAFDRVSLLDFAPRVEYVAGHGDEVGMAPINRKRQQGRVRSRAGSGPSSGHELCLIHQSLVEIMLPDYPKDSFNTRITNLLQPLLAEGAHVTVWAPPRGAYISHDSCIPV